MPSKKTNSKAGSKKRETDASSSSGDELGDDIVPKAIAKQKEKREKAAKAKAAKAKAAKTKATKAKAAKTKAAKAKASKLKTAKAKATATKAKRTPMVDMLDMAPRAKRPAAAITADAKNDRDANAMSVDDSDDDSDGSSGSIRPRKHANAHNSNSNPRRSPRLLKKGNTSKPTALFSAQDFKPNPSDAEEEDQIDDDEDEDEDEDVAEVLKPWSPHPVNPNITLAQSMQVMAKLPTGFMRSASEIDIQAIVAEYVRVRQLPDTHLSELDAEAIVAELSRRSHDQADHTHAMEKERARRSKKRRRDAMPDEGAPVPARDSHAQATGATTMTHPGSQPHSTSKHNPESQLHASTYYPEHQPDATAKHNTGSQSHATMHHSEHQPDAAYHQFAPTFSEEKTGPFVLYGDTHPLGPSAGTRRRSAAKVAAIVEQNKRRLASAMNPLARFGGAAATSTADILEAHADMMAQSKILSFDDAFSQYDAESGHSHFPAHQFLAARIKESYGKYVGPISNKIVAMAAAEGVSVKPSTALSAKMIYPNFEMMPVVGCCAGLMHVIRRNEFAYWTDMATDRTTGEIDKLLLAEIKIAAFTNLVFAYNEVLAFCMIYTLPSQFALYEAIGRTAVMNNKYMRVLPTVKAVIAEVKSRPGLCRMRPGFSAGEDQYRMMFPNMKLARPKKKRRQNSPGSKKKRTDQHSQQRAQQYANGARGGFGRGGFGRGGPVRGGFGRGRGGFDQPAPRGARGGGRGGRGRGGQ